MPESRFAVGQRWVSESEPELGLGSVITVGDHEVQLHFAAGEAARQYAIAAAPLRRVSFAVGDRIRVDSEADDLVVDAVTDDGGVLTYICGARSYPETALSDAISFSHPDARLQGGHVDESHVFDLRVQALHWRHDSRQSPIRGFVGGRIDLIPHQLFIAAEVAGRPAPRVLLADEVGLGKTIEACLILHRLIVSGLAARILILVPGSLIHQWFLELYRRFNLWFSIYDEERCNAARASSPGGNPFLDEQLVLCSVEFLADAAESAASAVAAGWDVLVVDEAHHLTWTPESPGEAYAMVEALSRQTPGLLLLTATPEQLGHQGHFARLRLLDPDRYPDFDRFESEAAQFITVAEAAGKLADGEVLSTADAARIAALFPEDPQTAAALLTAVATGDDAARAELLEQMLDRHGTGRVMFRNTRGVIKGFPKRLPQLSQIDAAEETVRARLSVEFAGDVGLGPEPSESLTDDPRITWLTTLLKATEPEKILLICRTKRKAKAIEDAVQRQLSIKAALFHEDLPLLQRDRNAAWFAEGEGARLLICSEIGSEGRNFQFAHRLVLFDLPLDPELLEQRIGRLDRIGQSQDIRIHVPFVSGSPQARLVQWYNDGLDAFSAPTTDAGFCLDKFRHRLLELACASPAESAASWRQLLADTQAYHQQLTAQSAAGRDRLLELNSCRPRRAAQIVKQIRRDDDDRSLDQFMLDIFDLYGIAFEELSPRTYLLGAEQLYTDAFPCLTSEGATVTFGRPRALAHEHLAFLTRDHPMVAGAVDLLLGSERGNSAVATLPADDRAVLLEALFVLEPIAPAQLHADRFLAPTPIRVVIDHRLSDRTAEFPTDVLQRQLRDGADSGILAKRELTQTLLPNLVTAAVAAAGQRAAKLRAAAITVMTESVTHELERLTALRRINDHVREEELALLRAQECALRDRLAAADVRLDAVRLIWAGPT